MIKNVFKISLLSLVTFSVVGCGDTSNSNSDSNANIIYQAGYLSDSDISGVTYVCGNKTGVTSSDGMFEYRVEDCSDIEFSIGGIKLGSLSTENLEENATFYPADLLGLDRDNTSDTTLVNMLQILQSLDSDNNPNNGIDINQTTKNKLSNFNLDANQTTDSDLTNVAATAEVLLVERNNAIAHYEDTLRNDFNISIDTVAPAPAIVVSNIESTPLDTYSVTINGERNAKVLVDGIDTNITISSNNDVVLNLDISDIALNTTDIESKVFAITLVDDTNKTSNSLAVTLNKYNQRLRDIEEVDSIKNAMVGLDSNSSREYSYTQQWDTGNLYQINMSESPRAISTENQTYDVVATISKGEATDTITFSESIPFSQELRDVAEVAAIKTALLSSNNPRALNPTQLWITGDNYTLSTNIPAKIQTTENQTYDVTYVFAKGSASDSVIISETIPYSQNLRDVAEVAAIKTALLSSNNPRAFTYTQLWNTGDSYLINASEPSRTQTTENQTYSVTYTISKGATTDSLTLNETVPYSQSLRDAIEVANIRLSLENLANNTDMLRAYNSYLQQWNTGNGYSISFSENKRIPTAIDQEYLVTVTIKKGDSVDSFTFTEFVPTTNVNIDFKNSASALINDEYAAEYSVTDGGVFNKIGYESQFVGSAIALNPAELSSTVSNSTELLSYMITNSGVSGLSSISTNVGSDGSLTARYEVGTIDTNLYELLTQLLGSVNYSILDNIDFSQFNDVNNSYIDFYVEYDPETSYAIITITDKTLGVDSDITKVINKDSIVEANEVIVNKQEDFTFNATQPKGDFLFVMDDSGSMSEEQSAAIEAIGRTFSAATSKYNLDWKASVVGTSYNDTYSSLLSNPSFNDINKTKEQLNLGTYGSGDERGVKRAYLSIVDGYLDIRENSSLTVIYASDELCHTSISEIGSPDGDLSDSYFVQNGIRFNTIMPTNYQNDTNLAYKMSLATGGDSSNIYNYESGYDAMMDLAVRYAVAKSSSVKIAYPALASSISVHKNGIKETEWEYDSTEQAIVFAYSSMPSQDDNITVTYSHLDYSSMVSSAKIEFDDLNNSSKRAYTNNNIDVIFDPATPLLPLANQDQTYDVTVTFSKFGYTQTSTYQETIEKAEFQITANTDWLQDGMSFSSQNHSNSSASSLNITFVKDTNISYSVSSESNYDYLKIYKNGSLIDSYSGSQSGTHLFDANDTVEFKYSKDSGVSSGTDAATIVIQ